MDNYLQMRIDKGLKKEIDIVCGKQKLSMSEFVRRAVLRELSRYYVQQEELENNIINQFINETNKGVK